MFERETHRSGLFTTCDGFDVTFTATVKARYIVSLDDEGQPTREIRHVSFTGSLNSPAAELPYSGHFTRTVDVGAQWARFTGLHFRVNVPGGPPLVAAGTDAFSLDPTVDDTRATGRLPDAFFADVCLAMAG